MTNGRDLLNSTPTSLGGESSASWMQGQPRPELGGRKKSVNDLTRQPISRAGWVQKKSDSSRRNWKRRYLVLRGNKLLYFTREVGEDAVVRVRVGGEKAVQPAPRLACVLPAGQIG